MRQYDEKLKERIFSGSDRRTLFGENDPRGKLLFHGATLVTRLKAKEIRELGGGKYLVPVKAEDAEQAKAADAAEGGKSKATAAPKAPHPNVKTDTAGAGPDFIIDWGRAHKGKRLGDLTDKQVLAITKSNTTPERKALANAEIARRKTAAPAAPPAPLNYGPEDTPNIGVHQDVAVKDYPEDFLNSLANGEDEAHKDWAATEIQRRKDAV